MAQGSLGLDRETFSCSICLDLPKDPVTIPCGHSYCSSCITRYWDRQEGIQGITHYWNRREDNIHSCPQCRKRFRSRPQLQKNYMLAALLEQMRNTSPPKLVQAAPAGAEDVACDVCTGRKLKAIKSCLVCLASYCHTHLKPHCDAAPLKKHQLVEPSKNLQENICSHSQHNEVMKMFCRTDQQCVCYLCCVDEHKGHDIVSAAAERREKQEKLQETQQSIQQRIQDTEGEVKELQQEMNNIRLSADKAVEHSHQTYRQLICLMEERSREVERQIRSQQEAEVRRVQEVGKKLEQELSKLRSKAAELQKLSLIEDHCRFLHSYSSATVLAGSTRLHIRPRHYFKDMTAVVSESSLTIQQLLRNTWKNISLTYMDVLLSAEPKTRAEFLRYSRDITLDPNTAHTQLILSEGNRRAAWTLNHQPHPPHPDRFRMHGHVLSRESLTGRCYWEVEVGGATVYVAVAYKNNIGLVGGYFGYDDKSWALHCYNQSYGFRSNSITSTISGPWSSRVGVYLDHPAGLLSFYSVSDSMTLLRRVHTSFTQPLHVGLYVCGSSAELVKPK